MASPVKELVQAQGTDDPEHGGHMAMRQRGFHFGLGPERGPFKAAFRASIFSGGKWLRFAKVRVLTLPPSR